MNDDLKGLVARWAGVAIFVIVIVGIVYVAVR